jgi:RsiW-degrading membrane proteinase PrsW (M82 family)
MHPAVATTPGQAVPPDLLLRPRRRGSVWFTALVSLALLAGAGLMALVLVASDAPDAIVVGVVLAAVPVGPVVAAYLWLDRYEPEPPSLLGLAFGWGALVATAAALVLQGADHLVGASQGWSGAFLAPLSEELTKGLFVVLLLWFRRHEIDGVLDGLVYAGLVGVGFAFTENILYLASAYVGDAQLGTSGGIGAATGLFVVRGVFSVFAHPLFTSCIGIGVGFAVTTRRPALRVLAPVLGFALAVGLHAAWNSSAFFDNGQWFLATYLVAMVPAFLLLVGFAVWARREEARVLTRSLTDAARRGFLGEAEVPWLVRLPARRAARQQARRVGGREAERLTRAYQQEAIELAFLHDRFLRGNPPRDAALRGQAMIQRLALLRPFVFFPRSGAYLGSGM